MRKYPIGIQTFSEIIRVYVDKTDLVWQMAHYAKYIFLSRPRRFGKSLLTSTLESYFRGERELFEGLKIMELEQEWTQYPVIRLDLSGAKHMPTQGVRDELARIVSEYEKPYGRSEVETTPGMRFAGIVNRAYEQAGRQVAVIIRVWCSAIGCPARRNSLERDSRGDARVLSAAEDARAKD